jgi:hypothetical protein
MSTKYPLSPKNVTKIGSGFGGNRLKIHMIKAR